jgi:hypothetical protein
MINIKKRKEIYYNSNSKHKTVNHIVHFKMPPIVTQDYYDNVLIKPTLFGYTASKIGVASFLVYTIDELVHHNLFGPCLVAFGASLSYEFNYYGKTVSYEELKNIKLKNRIKQTSHKSSYDKHQKT